jgi:CheY-like chemotaxis protein
MSVSVEHLWKLQREFWSTYCNFMDVPPARKTVLLVEDDRALRQLYRLALEFRGYDVDVAADGVSALEAVEGGSVPDLVVLDVGLPRMSGLSVAADLAAHPATSAIPVIIVTGTTEPFDEHPYAHVLHKPVGPDELVDVVARAFDGMAGHSAVRR